MEKIDYGIAIILHRWDLFSICVCDQQSNSIAVHARDLNNGNETASMCSIHVCIAVLSVIYITVPAVSLVLYWQTVRSVCVCALCARSLAKVL